MFESSFRTERWYYLCCEDMKRQTKKKKKVFKWSWSHSSEVGATVRSNWAVVIVYLQFVPVGAKGNGPVLHRQKRHWITAPRRLKENFDYTGYQSVAKVCPLPLHCFTIVTNLSDIPQIITARSEKRTSFLPEGLGFTFTHCATWAHRTLKPPDSSDTGHLERRSVILSHSQTEITTPVYEVWFRPCVRVSDKSWYWAWLAVTGPMPVYQKYWCTCKNGPFSLLFLRWFYLFVFQIHSDKQNYTRIFYSLTGPGVDQPPLNVFSVDPNTGFVKVHSILDREEVAEYNVK